MPLPPGMSDPQQSTQSATPPGMADSSVSPPAASMPPGMDQQAAQAPTAASLPPGMDAPSSQPPGMSAPSPIATPHKYDSVMQEAAKGAGVDLNLLRSVGMQESGLGTSGNFDPATGLDKDGNQGHGLFQLDPASGAPRDVLDRAAKDPKFAATYAAGMLKRAMSQTNGDLRGALAIYNSGSATSDKGLAYADEVMSRMGSLDAPNTDPAFVQQIKHDAKTVQTQMKKGKSLSVALAHTKTGKATAEVEAAGTSRWQWAKDHPLEAFGDVLEAPQHFLGGFEHIGATNPHGLLPGIHDAVMDYVLNPTDKHNEESTAGPRETISRFAQQYLGRKGNAIPTHEDIDNFVHAHVHGALAPYAAGVAKFGEDFAQQIISDPLQSGEIYKLGRGAAAATASGLAKAAQATANGLGIGKHVAPHFQALSQVADHLADVFVARRDLDRAGFTKDGKLARQAIENSEMILTNKRRDLDDKAINSASDATARAMQYIRFHGNAAKSAVASGLAGQPAAKSTGRLVIGDVHQLLGDLAHGTPEERGEILAGLRRQVEKGGINEKTKDLVKTGGKKYFAGNPQNLGNLSTEDTSGYHQAFDKFEKTTAGQALGRVSSLGKKSIMWNPAPHGLKNVGTLAYLAGGLPAVMHGMAGMIKGVPAATLSRLEKMGAAPLYTHTPHAAAGGIKGALNTADTAISQVMERMEQGWRAGLLNVMDKKLGASAPGSPEEMLKGAMISKHIGDYRNQSAFVHLFKTLGGPFVAFRLGIVPGQVGKAVVNHPGRVTNVIRTQQDLNSSRSKKGQRANTIVNGGPVEDFAKMVLTPKKFIASPSTSGIVGTMLGGGNNHDGIVGHILDLAESYLPGTQPAVQAATILSGNGAPGQKSSWADKVFQVFHDMGMGGYEQAKPKPNSEHKKYKYIKKDQGV